MQGGIDFELFRPELDATLDRSDDGARAPDETTIRRFREALVRTGAVKKLLARFDAHLKDAGYPVMGGGIPPDWQANPRKPAQKDRDARWTLKRGRRKTRPPGKPMPVHHERANAAESKVRSAIGTSLRRDEGTNGALRPHHRHRPGEGQDRHGHIAFNMKRLLFRERKGAVA